MNEHFHRLRQEQKQETEHEQRERQNNTVEEFNSVEEMIRTDLAQTEVPPGVAERINRSVGKESPPETSWWKRLFGGK